MGRGINSEIVLDTCAWIWMATGDSRIGKNIQKSLSEQDWLISAISVWEVAMLTSKKRMQLDRPIQQWIKAALIDPPHIHLAPLSPEISILSCSLPTCTHGDPADRIILATAKWHDAVLVTGDEKLIRCANTEHIRVIEI